MLVVLSRKGCVAWADMTKIILFSSKDDEDWAFIYSYCLFYFQIPISLFLFVSMFELPLTVMLEGQEGLLFW